MKYFKRNMSIVLAAVMMWSVGAVGFASPPPPAAPTLMWLNQIAGYQDESPTTIHWTRVGAITTYRVVLINAVTEAVAFDSNVRDWTGIWSTPMNGYVLDLPNLVDFRLPAGFYTVLVYSVEGGVESLPSEAIGIREFDTHQLLRQLNPPAGLTITKKPYGFDLIVGEDPVDADNTSGYVVEIYNRNTVDNAIMDEMLPVLVVDIGTPDLPTSVDVSTFTPPPQNGDVYSFRVIAKGDNNEFRDSEPLDRDQGRGLGYTYQQLDQPDIPEFLDTDIINVTPQPGGFDLTFTGDMRATEFDIAVRDFKFTLNLASATDSAVAGNGPLTTGDGQYTISPDGSRITIRKLYTYDVSASDVYDGLAPGTFDFSVTAWDRPNYNFDDNTGTLRQVYGDTYFKLATPKEVATANFLQLTFTGDKRASRYVITIIDTITPSVSVPGSPITVDMSTAGTPGNRPVDITAQLTLPTNEFIFNNDNADNVFMRDGTYQFIVQAFNDDDIKVAASNSTLVVLDSDEGSGEKPFITSEFDTPDVSQDNGEVEWTPIKGATKYWIEVYKNGTRIGTQDASASAGVTAESFELKKYIETEYTNPTDRPGRYFVRVTAYTGGSYNDPTTKKSLPGQSTPDYIYTALEANNVYTSGNEDKGVVPRGVIDTNLPNGYTQDELRLVKDSLGESTGATIAMFQAAIRNSDDDPKIASYIEANPNLSGSDWWDVYLTSLTSTNIVPMKGLVNITTGPHPIDEAAYDYMVLRLSDDGSSVTVVKSGRPISANRDLQYEEAPGSFALVRFNPDNVTDPGDDSSGGGPGGSGGGPGGSGGSSDPTNPTNPTTPTNPTNPTNPTTPTNPTNPTTSKPGGNGDRGDDWWEDGWTSSTSYNTFWNKVERFIGVARSGEYINAVLPYTIDTVPDDVLEALERRSVTLVIEDSVGGRRYRLYGPDIYEDRLNKREYELSELYSLVGVRDSYDEPLEDYSSYDRNPTTGGTGYVPISSSLPDGDTYNPGTGGLIQLFSNTRTIDPLPDIDAVGSLRVEHDPVAMVVLVAFFTLAAALPFVEMLVRRKRRRQPQTAAQTPKPASPLRIPSSEPSAQSIVRKMLTNRK